MAPFTMAAVMPSMLDEAPCAAFAAVCSMLDRAELTDLMDALALTSTSTTSSSLLSAMVECSESRVDLVPLSRENDECAGTLGKDIRDEGSGPS